MVEINLSYDENLSIPAKDILKDRYMLPEEESPQEAFARAANAFSNGDSELAQKIYEYAAKGWMMFSTPILSNGGTKRGMPIACFGGYVPDSRTGITDHYTENAWLSSMGGGIGGYWGDVRSDGISTSKGSKSTGSIPFIKVVDSQMLAFSQGSSRRGSYAAYMDISHPEIEEFIGIRKPTGDHNRKSLNLHHAVIIPDSFMEAVKEGKSWDLIDPHTKKITKTVDAQSLWISILNTRVETGEPYIMWSDTCNSEMPEELKNKGLKIKQSNLCSEIILPTNEERTFVCCLSSVNLEYYEEWKNTTIIRDVVRFLDNVLTFFIENAPDEISKAKYSAMMSRDIGLGAMGFHAFLQRKGIPFEGAMAKVWNNKIFKFIKEEAVKETKLLAQERGKAPDSSEKNPVRNMHLLAIAPNASSSIICGTSPSIEPYAANYYRQNTLSGSFEMKNPYLIKTLEKYGRNDSKTWKEISEKEGSVQHLEFLSQEDKDIFKTSNEINQRWIIEHAADRQKYICQAQSVNLFFPPNENGEVEASYLHAVHFSAWEKGLKTLYYLRSKSLRRIEKVNVRIERKTLLDSQNGYEITECLSCQG